jgi:hypothetical protein
MHSILPSNQTQELTLRTDFVVHYCSFAYVRKRAVKFIGRDIQWSLSPGRLFESTFADQKSLKIA